MNYSMRILIPTAIGLAAAVMNWIYLSSHMRPLKFTVAAHAIKEGQTMTIKDFKHVDIPRGQSPKFDKVAVPFREMPALVGQVARRTIEQDDLIFWSDAPLRGDRVDRRTGDGRYVNVVLGRSRTPPLDIGCHVEIQVPTGDPTDQNRLRKWLGPFRLIAIDGHPFATSYSAKGEQFEGREIDSLTVAIPEKRDQKHVELEDYIDREAQFRQAWGDYQLQIRVVKGP